MRQSTNFLTVEGKTIYFELKAKMYRAELMNFKGDSEYCKMYRKASKVLLGAVE